MTFVSALLHNIHIISLVFSGFGKVAVLPSLPYKELISASEKVLPVPEMLDKSAKASKLNKKSTITFFLRVW